MQPNSEKCSYWEELSCKEGSLKENQFCFNQNQDRAISGMFRRAEKYLIRDIFYSPVNKVRGLNSFGPSWAFILTKNSLLCS